MFSQVFTKVIFGALKFNVPLTCLIHVTLCWLSIIHSATLKAVTSLNMETGINYSR